MLNFDKNFSPEYGVVTRLSPLVRRIVAHNPSPFTFMGTGTYIVGQGTVAVIDPGPAMPSHLHALEQALEGEVVSHILITHNHMDHSPAARPFQKVVGGGIYAFDPSQQTYSDNHTEEGLDTSFHPDHLLRDGDVIKGNGWTLEVLHTPGHLSNHLCFALREEKALFSGDHVMGWSTTVISPPDGHMGAYLQSLERLLARDDEIYYPTHGNPIPNPQHYVRGLIAHRQHREEQILQVIRTGAATIPEMVDIIYADVPSYLHPAAARSVLAHLIHMVEDGRLVTSGHTDEQAVYRLP
ncbi:MBL fold metallo-hydrolase [Luteithermobacter gelatinilyticus]|uniref:MBL fold metallo-hydrolase n=1 Tax=Luteithermobacter gelatinilyticus TaxID=2582913 RepID=UPI001105DCA8|nr:MBL fold metallo-hydrolase [Luteithermobacter gelatinilyticus]